jgi:ribosomal protein S18 acetylase RimI-like enzyme
VKLTDDQKTVGVYNQLRRICSECFSGIENPPERGFLTRFETGDVFIQRCDIMKGIGFGDIVSYAIVDTASPDAHLWQIATKPGNKGHGHATDLLKEIAETYRELKYSIWLTVKVDNVGAQMLYLKNGYKVESVLYEYYGPEQNGLCMRKEF